MNKSGDALTRTEGEWHSLSKEEVLNALAADHAGLSVLAIPN